MQGSKDKEEVEEGRNSIGRRKDRKWKEEVEDRRRWRSGGAEGRAEKDEEASQPAKPEGQIIRPEGLPAKPEGQPAKAEGQLAKAEGQPTKAEVQPWGSKDKLKEDQYRILPISRC